MTTYEKGVRASLGRPRILRSEPELRSYLAGSSVRACSRNIECRVRAAQLAF
jgi:hypothetical protein